MLKNKETKIIWSPRLRYIIQLLDRGRPCYSTIFATAYCLPDLLFLPLTWAGFGGVVVFTKANGTESACTLYPLFILT